MKNILRILKDSKILKYLKSENNNLNQFKFKYNANEKIIIHTHINCILFYDVVYITNDIFKKHKIPLYVCADPFLDQRNRIDHIAHLGQGMQDGHARQVLLVFDSVVVLYVCQDDRDVCSIIRRAPRVKIVFKKLKMNVCYLQSSRNKII